MFWMLNFGTFVSALARLIQFCVVVVISTDVVVVVVVVVVLKQKGRRKHI